jgi:hypothetical protein
MYLNPRWDVVRTVASIENFTFDFFVAILIGQMVYKIDIPSYYTFYMLRTLASIVCLRV